MKSGKVKKYFQIMTQVAAKLLKNKKEEIFFGYKKNSFWFCLFYHILVRKVFTLEFLFKQVVGVVCKSPLNRKEQDKSSIGR